MGRRGDSVANNVSLKEHFDALRAADQRLFEALRSADATFDRERDRAVEKATATALASIEKATALLASTYRSDKAQQNEWRGTINDVISKLGGMRALWGWIVAGISVGFVAWRSLVSP